MERALRAETQLCCKLAAGANILGLKTHNMIFGPPQAESPNPDRLNLEGEPTGPDVPIYRSRV